MSLNKETVFNPPEFIRSLHECQEPLPLFRNTLRQGREVIKAAHFERGRAQEIVTTHAWLVDQILMQAWQLHLPLLPQPDDIALVAVGGYGRGELHPFSDIDLMLLLRDGSGTDVHRFVEALLQFLWDLGLEVGHSVRSVPDCIVEAKNDITVATNLMEARLIYGDPGLFEQMCKATSTPKVWPSKKFFAAKLKEQTDRHHHFNDTAYNLEPNIKEGPGGLRDIQMIMWVAQRHFNCRSLNELVDLKLLNKREHNFLVRGRNFLWSLRNWLHYLGNRREDRLLFDYQRVLASELGYTDSKDGLAVEQFMKHYYRTIKGLSRLNEILLQHFQETILYPKTRKPKPLSQHFRSHSGFLAVTGDKVFERAPGAMLEMFLVMEQHPELKGIRAQTIRLLHDNLHRIDAEFRRDETNRTVFMEILRQPRGVTHTLRRMNAHEILGAYIPAFGKIVGQMQHDLFHVYTVDEHTMFVIRNLRRFTVPEFRREFPFASSIIQQIAKPERLYVAALFHDIAKGREGDHSVLGEAEAQKFCKQHGLSEYDTRFVCWLVRNHLIMSWTSQRQDISDPNVVIDFAAKVGDQERLDNLYLLTVADMRGTSPKVWNDWKGHLLLQLYTATSRVLARGISAVTDVEDRVADLRSGALEILNPGRSVKALTEQYWAQMDNGYFLRYNADSLAWHAQTVAARSAADFPIVATRFQPEIGGSELLIYTPSRDGLFVTLTGAFDKLNLSIVDARVHTTKHNFALDTFVVLDHNGEPIRDSKTLSQLEGAMREELNNPRPPRDAPRKHLPRQLKHFPITTEVKFGAAADEQPTIMEVIAQDRPGLLYQVARSLEHCHTQLIAAKISTYGERAEDVFFIADREGRPVTDSEQQKCLRQQIYERLQQGLDDKESLRSLSL